MARSGAKVQVPGWNQDGGVERREVCVSPQLGHLPDAGGGPRRPKRWEEPLSEQDVGGLRGEEKWRLGTGLAPLRGG